MIPRLKDLNISYNEDALWQKLALEEYARQAKDQELERWVKEIRLRAERRTGELLEEMEKQRGNRGAPGPGRGNKTASLRDEAVLARPATLKDLGITHNESSLGQKLAALPECEFASSREAALGHVLHLSGRARHADVRSGPSSARTALGADRT